MVMVMLETPLWWHGVEHLAEPDFFTNLVEKQLHVGNLAFITKSFNESEPNNTLAQANDLGTFIRDEMIKIHGHLNGHTDPYDYYIFKAPEAGQFDVTMYRNNNLNDVAYQATYTADRAGDKFNYYAWATGSADLNYTTAITFTPNDHIAYLNNLA